jgi:hypothetical protein
MKNFPAISTFAIIIFLIWRSRKNAKKSGKASKKSSQKRDVSMIDSEITAITDEIDFFSTYKDHDVAHASDSIVLQKDEHLLAEVIGVGFVENKTTEDGVSPFLLDEGAFIITTVRGVFVGKTMTHDFQWTKLISHKSETVTEYVNIVTYLPVSNRQKIYGIATNIATNGMLQKRLSFGVAVALGRQEQHIDGLKAEREKLIQEKRQLVSVSTDSPGLSRG